jgi:hypothetical protein
VFTEGQRCGGFNALECHRDRGYAVAGLPDDSLIASRTLMESDGGENRLEALLSSSGAGGGRVGPCEAFGVVPQVADEDVGELSFVGQIPVNVATR